MSELEPDAEDLLRAGKNVAEEMSSKPALYSIAISLKRIADALEKQEHSPEFWAGIAALRKSASY